MEAVGIAAAEDEAVGIAAAEDEAVGITAAEDEAVGTDAAADAAVAAATAFFGEAAFPARYASEEHTAIAITATNNQLATWARPRTISNSALSGAISGASSCGAVAGAVCAGDSGSVSKILSMLH